MLLLRKLPDATGTQLTSVRLASMLIGETTPVTHAGGAWLTLAIFQELVVRGSKPERMFQVESWSAVAILFTLATSTEASE